MIVVDANVIAYFWLKSPFFQQVQSLYAADSDWITPELCRSEFRNILAAYIRKGYYTLDQALALIGEKEKHMFGSYMETESVKILELVSTGTCSAYDCEYVSLAMQTARPLITYDKKILKEFPQISWTPELYLNSLK
jgi:PIN domain.